MHFPLTLLCVPTGECNPFTPLQHQRQIVVTSSLLLAHGSIATPCFHQVVDSRGHPAVVIDNGTHCIVGWCVYLTLI